MKYRILESQLVPDSFVDWPSLATWFFEQNLYNQSVYFFKKALASDPSDFVCDASSSHSVCLQFYVDDRHL